MLCRFMQNSWVDPGYWQRKTFVNDVIDPHLPKPKPRSELVAMEIQPTDGRYLSLLLPANISEWYLEVIYMVGTNLASMEDSQLEVLTKEAAVGCRSTARFVRWTDPSHRWKMKPRVVDMILLSDGGATSLGADLMSAMTQAKRVLKNDGRFYIVANEEDERMLGGKFEDGLKNSPMLDLGFELVAAAKGGGGLFVGYLRKKKQRLKTLTNEASAEYPPSAKLRRAKGMAA